MILLIGGIAGLIYYFNKKQKSKSITKTTTATTIEAKQENIPKEKSNWNGECFVFDSRVSVRNELQLGTYEMCHGCRKPLNKFDIKSKKYEKGVACENCYNKTSAEKKKRLRERNKQIKISKTAADFLLLFVKWLLPVV